MSEGIVIALIGALGAVVVAIPTIIINRSSNIKHQTIIDMKIEALTKAVEKHNSVVDRMYCAEERISVLEERQKTANHRIDDLEEKR